MQPNRFRNQLTARPDDQIPIHKCIADFHGRRRRRNSHRTVSDATIFELLRFDMPRCQQRIQRLLQMAGISNAKDGPPSRLPWIQTVQLHGELTPQRTEQIVLQAEFQHLFKGLERRKRMRTRRTLQLL